MTTYARRVGLFPASMLVVGGIIGSGIFLNPSVVAARAGSSTLIISAWVLGGVIAILGAFIFAELGARRPATGGGYIYLREAWGPLPAFLYAWTILLVIGSGAIAAVAIAIACSNCAVSSINRSRASRSVATRSRISLISRLVARIPRDSALLPPVTMAARPSSRISKRDLLAMRTRPSR